MNIYLFIYLIFILFNILLSHRKLYLIFLFFLLNEKFYINIILFIKFGKEFFTIFFFIKINNNFQKIHKKKYRKIFHIILFDFFTVSFLFYIYYPNWKKKLELIIYYNKIRIIKIKTFIKFYFIIINYHF